MVTLVEWITFQSLPQTNDKLQLFLQRACQDLGLSGVIPFPLIVRKDICINAQALLPQLGGPKGMIVVTHYDDLLGIESELLCMGYGYSILSEPLPSEEYDLETYVDMFSDWG